MCNPFTNQHTFVWSDGSTEITPIPPGVVCQCGAYVWLDGKALPRQQTQNDECQPYKLHYQIVVPDPEVHDAHSRE